MASRPTVALIGGGVVGLALARSLAMSGVAVTILEAAPHLLSRYAHASVDATMPC
jgi:NADPH-dependent 2,4-dienoyl-CoA reductase/sulfur reductase-like enzyme